MYHKPIIFITAGIFAFGTAFNAGAVNICAADNTAVAAHTQRYNNTNRPPEKERLFKSKAVESEIKRIKKLLKNPKLAWMFENCFPNTIDTTVHFRLDETASPTHLCTPATSTPCGCATPAHRCGHTFSWQTTTLS